MSGLLLTLATGAAGGTAALSTQVVISAATRRIHRRHPTPPMRSANGGNGPDISLYANSRQADVAAYGDHLAGGNTHLREHLRRFEKPNGQQQYRPGERPW
ncbi:hypothetical protein BKA23_1390 [Rudaeicoccus suwonensis]|uniref:Uncharacterized protein n=1 Tax=Rudaeicoccus suwonensis TaxID=657409 RepID=A0A561EAF9_9MICO|nr:hypothetical protein BKA23_1390 [Rudaeicoccus suwonensis]